MKVYLVFQGSYDKRSLQRVYGNEGSARAYAESITIDTSILPCHDPALLPIDVEEWTLRIEDDGK